MSLEMREMTVADVMQRWPVTIQVFNSRRMACPGCVMAPFMTVADAADSYALDAADLVAELMSAAGEPRLAEASSRGEPR